MINLYRDLNRKIRDIKNMNVVLKNDSVFGECFAYSIESIFSIRCTATDIHIKLNSE